MHKLVVGGDLPWLRSGNTTATFSSPLQSYSSDVKCCYVLRRFEVCSYPSADNFFEMMRFDLVVDEDLKVYLLEANMSPNLSSAHFAPNQLLYEQVLYNLFALTGVANHIGTKGDAAQNMISAQKNVAVWSDECRTTCQDNCEASAVCGLCKPCLGARMKRNFLNAHREFLHRGDFRRLFPPAMQPNIVKEEDIKDLSSTNRLQFLWYQGKCNVDPTWCT